MDSRKIVTRFLFSVYLCLFIFVNLYPFEWLLSSWIKSTHYQHCLFFIFIIGIVFYQKFKVNKWIINTKKTHFSWIDYLFLILLIGASLFADYYLKSPFVGVLSIWALVKYLLFKFIKLKASERVYICLFLLILTPLPFIYHLTSYLQISSSFMAANLINIFGIDSEVSSGRIVIKSGTFIVGPASSGIRSFLVLPTFAFILLIWRSYKLKLGMVFILLSFFTAQIYNIIRVASMIIVAVFTDPIWAYDAFHDKGNTIVFLVSMLNLYWLYKKICQK